MDGMKHLASTAFRAGDSVGGFALLARRLARLRARALWFIHRDPVRRCPTSTREVVDESVFCWAMYAITELSELLSSDGKGLSCISS